jgi:flagellar hook-length control protein FliK
VVPSFADLLASLMTNVVATQVAPAPTTSTVATPTATTDVGSVIINLGDAALAPTTPVAINQAQLQAIQNLGLATIAPEAVDTPLPVSLETDVTSTAKDVEVATSLGTHAPTTEVIIDGVFDQPAAKRETPVPTSTQQNPSNTEGKIATALKPVADTSTGGPTAAAISPMPKPVTDVSTDEPVTTLISPMPKTEATEPTEADITDAPIQTLAPVERTITIRDPRVVNQLPRAAADFAQQLAAQLTPIRTNGNGNYAMTLHLRPEGLGDVNIDVRLREGTIDLNFRVAAPETREMVRLSLGELKSQLDQAGVNSGQVDVGDMAREFQRRQENDATSDTNANLDDRFADQEIDSSITTRAVQGRTANSTTDRAVNVHL